MENSSSQSFVFFNYSKNIFGGNVNVGLPTISMEPRGRICDACTSGLVVCLLVPCDCDRVTVDDAELSVDDVESVDPDLVAIGFFVAAAVFPLDFVDC